MREFAVHFLIRKGLGPEWVPKTIFVGLDDIEPEMEEYEIRAWARENAESVLRNTEDYPVYGKNWIYKDMEEV